MISISWKYNEAKIFCKELESWVIHQIQLYVDTFISKGQKIVIMPDVHEGKGCVIGFTATLNEYIVPYIVGVDIGCGVVSYNLGNVNVSFEELDAFIRTNIPCGFKKHKKIVFDLPGDFQKNVQKLARKLSLSFEEILKSLGTLWWGNHFIELGKDEENNYWLTIHTGSRNFWLQVATYHQKKARKFCEREGIDIPKSLSFLRWEWKEEYFHDMEIAQRYASYNRYCIAKMIIEKFFWKQIDRVFFVESVHNYIDFQAWIIRKGAIAAQKEKYLVIPFNMRDGMIIGKWKGNPEWNVSAPHGAWRILSRNEALKTISLEDFKKSMEGIYTTCVEKRTIDESPMAYKNYKEILSSIESTVEIQWFIKPVYNFKASE